MFDHDGKFNDDDGIGEAQVPLWSPHTDLGRETEKMVNLDKLSKDKNMKPMLKMRRPTERTTVGSMSGRNSVSSSATSTFERHHSRGSLIEQHRVSEQHQSWSSGQQARRSRDSSSSSSSSSGSGSPARRLTSSGGLSLRELNDRLERYIQQVSLTPESNVTHIFRETVR